MKRQTVRHLILLISLLLFPLTLNYFSPYLIVVGASRGIITGSFIVFIVLLLSSLFLGRFFCGWLCPDGSFHGHRRQIRPADPSSFSSSGEPT